MSDSRVLFKSETQAEKPIVKKSDYFYYYLFWPVFQLPMSVTPNHISYLRIFICLPLCLLIWLHFFKTAGILFIIAALMDGLDGAMARMRNQVSPLGKILDPTADKLLNMTGFLSYLSYVIARSYTWLTLPIVLIDLLLFFTALNKYLIKDYLPNLPNKHWLRNWLDPQIVLSSIKVEQTGANNWGKAKMVIQVITLAAMMLFDPNASYFILPKISLPGQLTMYDFFQPLLATCVILGIMSLWGHLKVVKFQN